MNEIDKKECPPGRYPLQNGHGIIRPSNELRASDSATRMVQSDELGAVTSLSMAEQEEMITEMENIHKTIRAWRESSGMHTLLAELKKTKDSPLDVNDITLAMSTGIDAASDQAVNGVLESAVVSALLLSFSLPLVVNPPDSIAKLEKEDWRKLLHLYGWGLMSMIAVANILYARIYSAAMVRAARSSDKLRIHLAGNAFHEGLIMVYAMFVCFVLGVLPDAIVIYGELHGIIITAIIVFVAGGAVKLAYKYIAAGHIEYGWRGNRLTRNDPVNDMLIFETLRQRLDRAKRLNEIGSSFFEFSPTNEKKTFAQGISQEGQRMMRLDKKDS